ncbi:hypothetical protein fugu_013829 [Takifugu bimaculatus]|uniref:Uncharacterized protein n=1 Tax=Takifugu bimaculatus TaxID=433685 RepID=A0A4Z2C4C7_9TELE|nr:hypothetical protein fugu_013829 [Takifugu bimaculatus]
MSKSQTCCGVVQPPPPRTITSHLSKSHTDALACTIHAHIWSLPGPGLILPPTNTQRRVDRGCKQIIQEEENSSFTGRLQRAGAKRVCETHKRSWGTRYKIILHS